MTRNSAGSLRPGRCSACAFLSLRKVESKELEAADFRFRERGHPSTRAELYGQQGAPDTAATSEDLQVVHDHQPICYLAKFDLAGEVEAHRTMAWAQGAGLAQRMTVLTKHKMLRLSAVATHNMLRQPRSDSAVRTRKLLANPMARASRLPDPQPIGLWHAPRHDILCSQMQCNCDPLRKPEPCLV